MSAEPAEPTGSSWRLTPAFITAASISGALLYLAIALHRRDLLALASPLVGDIIIAAYWRPILILRVQLRASRVLLLEQESTTLHLVVETDRPVEVVTAMTTASKEFMLKYNPVQCSAARTSSRHEILQEVVALHWGRGFVGPATVNLWAKHGLLQAFVEAPAVPVRVVPLRKHFNTVDVVPFAKGNVGTHGSRYRGEGGDFAGVRPFGTGDRLKRINWRVSLRTGDIHVTTNASIRDADILLMIDSSSDVVSVDTIGRSEGSLDSAVRAAGSIAEHYLRNGDRVGLFDYARPLRPIRPATGRAHLHRIVDALIQVTPQPAVRISSTRVLSAVAPRSTIFLFGPFCGETMRDRGLAMRRSGHTVLIIDTLPRSALLRIEHEWTHTARRIEALRRESDMDQLLEHGIPVVIWRESEDLNQVLAQLSRAASAPRLVP